MRLVSTALVFLCVLLAAPVVVRIEMQPYMFQSTEAVPSAPVAIVLGASVRGNDPSPVLAARMDGAIELYNRMKVRQILITGDGRSRWYDEIGAMQKYLVAAGIPKNSIETDPAGYDTYTSMYRAVHVFHISNVIVVTQDFHMPRALMLAHAFGVSASGVVVRGGAPTNYAREVLSTLKALWDVAVQRTP